MTWFLAVALPFALAVNAGAIASLLVQRSLKVEAPDGRTVRVRLTATGVRWIPWTNWDASWVLADFWWVRRLRSERRTWSVTATRGWGEPTLIGEFASRSDAVAALPQLAYESSAGRVDVP